MDSPWRNCIVGIGEEEPSQLMAHPQNSKIHPRAQQQALGAAISEVGWVSPVIVARETQHVLDGHARIELAISRGETSVPVVYVDVPPDQEALVLATLDPIGNLAVTDRDALDALLRDVTTQDAGLADFLDVQQLAAVRVGHLDGASDIDGSPASKGLLGGARTHVVTVAVATTALATVERALAATGELGRGAALVALAQAYLDGHQSGE